MTSVSTDRRQGLNSSAAIKVPCQAATTANIVLNGLQTVDGVVLASGDRVLVKNQTIQSQNGIYIADTGTWTRDLDFDGPYDVVEGTIATVLHGTTYASTSWRVNTVNPIVGSTITFIQSSISAGDSNSIQFLQAGAGAIQRTVQSRLRDIVSVFDFMTAAQIADVQAETLTLDVTAAIQAAITQAYAVNGAVFFPPGKYSVAADTLDITGTSGVDLIGAHLGFQTNYAEFVAKNAGAYLIQLSSYVGSDTYNVNFKNLTFNGMALVQDVWKINARVGGEVSYGSVEKCNFLNVKATGALVRNTTAAAIFAESAIWYFDECGFAPNGAAGNQGVGVKLNNYGAWGWVFNRCHFDSQPDPCHFQMTAGSATLNECQFDNTPAATSVDIQFYNSASLTLNNCNSGSSNCHFVQTYNKTTTGKWDNYPLIINDCRMTSATPAPDGIYHATTSPLIVRNFKGSGVVTTGLPILLLIENSTYLYQTNRSATLLASAKAGASADIAAWAPNDLSCFLKIASAGAATGFGFDAYQPGVGPVPLAFGAAGFSFIGLGYFNVPNIPVHANNAAALAAGMIVGSFYRTGADPDPLCIVH